MSDGINRVFVGGNLTREPDLRFGNGPESAVLKFSVAANESYFDKRTNERKERVEFVNCVVFGKRAEALQKILTKGQFVVVEGSLSTSSFEKDGQKHYRTEVRCQNVILGGRGGRREDGDAPRTNGGGFGGRGGTSAPRSSFDAPPPDDGFGGDDLPFASQADTTRARFG